MPNCAIFLMIFVQFSQYFLISQAKSVHHQLLTLSLYIPMNTPLCTEHSHAINHLCGEVTCNALLCDRCFNEHCSSNGHSIGLMINPISIGFFLDFSQDLVKILEEWQGNIKNGGFGKGFEMMTGNVKFVFSTQFDSQVSKHCLAVINNYKTLITNNRSYVLNNKQNLSALYLPEFLKDFRSFLLQKWDHNGYNIAQQSKQELIRSYPYRFTYKSISFAPNADLLAQIESARLARLEPVRLNIFVDFQHQSRISVNNPRQITNEAKFLEQIRTVPQSVKMIDSFEEILEGSIFSCDENPKLKLILEESVETLSPNFLSQDDLERQIQQLLVANETLKQQNYRLRFQNDQLRQENSALRQGKKIEKFQIFQ